MYGVLHGVGRTQKIKNFSFSHLQSIFLEIIRFSIPYSNFKDVPLIYRVRENAILKGFVLEEMRFIFEATADLRE